MKKILFIIFITLTISLFANSFKIKSLNNDNRAKNILENYLRKIDFKIEGINHLKIYVGTKEDIKKIDSVTYKELESFKNDAYIIKLKNNSLYLIGTNKRSSIYAVYAFLERNLKCKFLSKNFEIIPQKAFIKKSNINYTSEARFNYREIFIKELENTDFAKKLALNGSFGHKAKRRSDFFINTYNQFTPFELIKHKYESLYPEFFCNGQLDFALNEVKEFANTSFKNSLKTYQDRPDDIFYIQHEDILSYCDSTRSQRLIKQYGSTSAPFLDYVNYIAKDNPSKNIYFEAYQWSRKAPNRFPKLSENLNIFFSDIEANFAKPLIKDENEEIYTDLLSWEKYQKDVFIWHYITNFNGYFQPFPSVKATAKNIKTFSKLNMVKGIFLQGAYETNFSNLSNLRAWVLSKLLWNPNLNENRLIQEFSYYYYGNAYKEVLEYFDLLESELKKTNSKLLVKTSINEPYLNNTFIKKAKKILDKGSKKVSKNSIYQKHLVELYSGLDYVELLRGTISKKDKQRFKNFIEKNNIKYFAEARDINSLLPYFNINRKQASIPKKVQNSSKEWLDFQEYELKLCCTTTIEDKKASSLSAVRMPGDKSDWGIQLDLSSIPKGGWKIYANVRIEKSKNISSLEYVKPALYYGIHGKGVKNLSIINTLKDENYHEVYIGKVNIESENENGQIWIRPPKDHTVKYIFVDRIFAIKE